jgi:hypothetical protein
MAFADLLARAAAIGASVRLEPKRCERSGLMTFVAHIHGETGRPSKYAVTGTQVVSIDMDAADRVLAPT